MTHSLLSPMSRPSPADATSTRKDISVAVRSLGLDPAKMPRHIAIIMDGNRRWAKNQGWNAIRGHSIGARTTREIIQQCSDLDIEALTLYTFSTENWKRSRTEIAALMRLIAHKLRDELPVLQRNNVRVRHIGRREGLPDHLLNQIDISVGETRGNSGMTLCLAINYGGRAELTDAFQLLARQVQDGALQPDDINEKLIEATLYTQGLPEPDLLIRTGGDLRVSNFLPWQIAYAELWVTPTLWPDFSVANLHRAIAEFQTRERRFGSS
ncbi:MAG TPA: isoprenyl transferase [Abditibacteriaceae bacterium]|nr:isoprenyl transferase [Abditibacteriaceae bacterium]